MSDMCYLSCKIERKGNYAFPNVFITENVYIHILQSCADNYIPLVKMLKECF